MIAGSSAGDGEPDVELDGLVVERDRFVDDLRPALDELRAPPAPERGGATSPRRG